MNDKELRALLPSDKELEGYEFKKETKKERELINMFYALKKYSSVQGSDYITRHKNFTRAVKWAARNFINKPHA